MKNRSGMIIVFVLAVFLSGSVSMGASETAASEKSIVSSEEVASWVELGFQYQKGLGVEKNLEESLRLFRQAAEAGSLEAMLALGDYYLSGATQENRDHKAAVEWFLRAAELGSVDAYGKMGMCCHFGMGVKRDDAEALKWYQKAFAAGGAKGYYWMGFCYEYGCEGKPDWKKSREYFQKAAEMGLKEAVDALAESYANPRSDVQDETQKFYWATRSAEAGNAEMQLALGEYYLLAPKKADRRPEEGVAWLRKAALQNNIEAMEYLAAAYMSGQGVERDEKLAMEWHEKAWNLRHPEAKYPADYDEEDEEDE